MNPPHNSFHCLPGNAEACVRSSSALRAMPGGGLASLVRARVHALQPLIIGTCIISRVCHKVAFLLAHTRNQVGVACLVLAAKSGLADLMRISTVPIQTFLAGQAHHAF